MIIYGGAEYRLLQYNQMQKGVAVSLPVEGVFKILKEMKNEYRKI